MDVAKRVANAEKLILIVYVSQETSDVALNLHEVSLQNNGITNFLFVSEDKKACEKMTEESIACFVYETGTVLQLHPTIMLELLLSDYTVLFIDTDIAFLRAPFTHIDCRLCDIALMADDWGDNVSLVYARPTIKTKMMYESMYDRCLDTDQAQTKLFKQSIDSVNEIYVVTLPMGKFLSGIFYFERASHVFAGDRPVDKQIVLFRNNWIFTTPAKIYRLKEHLLWMHETHGYYSSETRKYLTYGNVVKHDDSNVTSAMEKKALMNALAIGYILNRTVILPAFKCKEFLGKCPLNSFYKISTFDEVFGDMYREHVFLGHPKVPDSVKEGLSDVYLIVGNNKTTPEIKHNFSTRTLVPRNTTGGPTSDEIVDWFGGVTESILSFHSLYTAFYKFSLPEKHKKFEELLNNGLKSSNYRQHK